MNKYLLETKVSFTLFLLFYLFIAEASGTDLIVYSAPEGYSISNNYLMTVNGQAIPVYDARIDDPDNCGFAYFDFDGRVNVVVTVPDGFKSAKIRPLSEGIVPKIKGNRIEFEMINPCKLCLELNGSISYPLFIFANPLEISPPKPGDPDVRYFGPGFHDAGQINMKSNETVYIAGGAVVKGYFTASNASNIRICGRGIMDAHENNSTMIQMRDCKNISVDGILIVDQPMRRWTTSYWSCDSVVVNNIKILAGDDVSNDGIDIVSCHNFTVSDCFVKCTDDCIVIKALRTDRRSVKNILIEKCLLWNIQAFAIQIGPELDAPEISEILVKDCDLIHPGHTETNPNDAYYYYCGAIGILNGDDGDVHNVRYEDIRIEDPTAKIISLKIMKTQWNRSDAFGKIYDIYFDNIRVVDGKFAPSEILSYGMDKLFNGTSVKPGQLIENITFKNFNILGETITNVQEGGFIVCPAAVNMVFIK